MRHRKTGKRLGRNTSQRQALIRALLCGLFKYDAIETGLAKAKELRRFAEPLITLAKVDSTHHRRLAFARLRDKEAVSRLFTEIGPACANRPGGYTRVIRLDHRLGDGAPLAKIEIIDMVVKKEEGAKKK
ncbi:MAG: 50S ribosomal protein L17 [Candidatus Hydrogenedentes bacterium]|nr:50S ribosomal protein L17 [Candidatus Hydrogenedentota bacterium]